MLSKYWKTEHFDKAPKMMSHFRGTNNIFADYNNKNGQTFSLVCSNI